MYSTTYVGLDVHKVSISVAVAYDGQEKAESLAKIPNDSYSVKKLVSQLEKSGRQLVFCYEAGPCGYGLYRQITNLGHTCIVAAPSLIPRRPGQKVKTDRKDAEGLAHWLRAGELPSVWVPDQEHEAFRDLLRARKMAKEDLHQQRQRLLKMLLRLGLHCQYRNWSSGHDQWLRSLKLDNPGQQFVLCELIHAMDECQQRLTRLEKAAEHFSESSPLDPVIKALQALRGIAFITAATIVAEAGDLNRFETADQIMSYAGVTPTEHSSGDRSSRGQITRAGNAHLRFVVVEAAWHYRHRPAIGPSSRKRQETISEEIKQISWKAQCRLNGKYHRMIAKGKPPGVAVTAVARELLGFIWAVAHVVADTPEQVA